MPDVGAVYGLGGAEDGEEGKAGPGQAQGGGTRRSFSPDPENQYILILWVGWGGLRLMGA